MRLVEEGRGQAKHVRLLSASRLQRRARPYAIRFAKPKNIVRSGIRSVRNVH